MIKKLTIFLIFLTFLWFLLAAASVWGASQQVSSTLASTIIDRAEVILRDADNRTWSAGQLLTWLNDATLDVVTRTMCMESTEDIDLATTTLSYSITSDFITVKAVHYTDSDGAIWALKKSSPSSVGQNIAATVPSYYCIWADKILVWPLITRTSETVTLYYIERPTAIAASANLPTPHIFDQAIVYYMVAQAALEDLKPTRFMQLMSLYDAELKRIRADIIDYPTAIIE